MGSSAAIVKGGWLHPVEKPEFVTMQITYQTFDRLKENSQHNGNMENWDECLIRLVDFYEQNIKKF